MRDPNLHSIIDDLFRTSEALSRSMLLFLCNREFRSEVVLLTSPRWRHSDKAHTCMLLLAADKDKGLSLIFQWGACVVVISNDASAGRRMCPSEG